MLIEILDVSGEASLRVDVKLLRERLSRAIGHLPQPIAHVTISLVDDREMMRLHKKHLGLDTTTDVLTFMMSGPGEPISADLALCLDEAARQAAVHHHSIDDELLLYGLHGLLHCCGFDDHDEADFAAMHAEEDRILTAIGVGRVFSSTQTVHDETPNSGAGGST